MLAQRLNARTVLDSERVSSFLRRRLGARHPRYRWVPDCCPSRTPLQDIGTQTSLSFETSSSIRNEIAAYMEEERMLQEDSKDADLEDDDDTSLRGRNQYESLSLAELEMVRLC